MADVGLALQSHHRSKRISGGRSQPEVYIPRTPSHASDIASCVAGEPAVVHQSVYSQPSYPPDTTKAVSIQPRRDVPTEAPSGHEHNLLRPSRSSDPSDGIPAVP